MRARLIARYGPDAGAEFDIGGEATIGRGAGNTVTLSSAEVSQRHARIYFDADRLAYCLEDLESLNGTRLDGAPVERTEYLGRLNVLTFGGSSDLFFIELDRSPEAVEAAETVPIESRTRVDAEAPALPEVLKQAGRGAEQGAASAGGTQVDQAPAVLPAILARQGGSAADTAAVPPGGAPAADQPPAGPSLVLVIAGGPPHGFPLGQGENLVGRAGRAAVRLRKRELSRRHATLRVDGDRVWLRDEGSRNHTYLEGERITGEVEIRPGAELRFGHLEARLERAEPQDPAMPIRDDS